MLKLHATVEGLHYDILKGILIRVARSPSGAKCFANAISVCKAFRQFAEDGDILRAVAFDDLPLSGRWEMFQLRQGLVNRCAQAGHSEAQFIMIKIILVSTSQLLSTKTEGTDQETAKDHLLKENAQMAASFVENFLPDRSCSHTPGFDFNLVKVILSQTRVSERKELQPYMNNYLKYSIESSGGNSEQFLLLFNDFWSISLEQNMEQNLELCMEKLAGVVRKSCLSTYKNMQKWGLKEAELSMKELIVEEVREYRHHGGFSTTELLENMNMSVRRFKTMKTIVEEQIRKAIQRCSDNVELVSLGWSLLQDWSELGGSMDDVSELWPMALAFEAERAKQISKFDTLLCHLMTNKSS